MADYQDTDGMLIFDEMNLQVDLLWNTKSHVLDGLVDPDQNLSRLIKSLLSNDEPTEESILAKKVNAWQFKTFRHKTFMCETFMNGGNLDAESCLWQFSHVLRCLESSGFRVHALCCDAAPTNASFFGRLRLLKLTDQVWLWKDQVSCVHPLDPTRRIYLFHCLVHVLKSIRNRHFDASVSMKDDREGHVNWDFVIDSFSRDYDRIDNSAKTIGEVNAKAVKPDGWLKMMVSVCMSIYSDPTLAEVTNHVLCSLGITIPEPTQEDMLQFLRVSEYSSIVLKNWRVKHLRDNHSWNEVTMGKLGVFFYLESFLILPLFL